MKKDQQEAKEKQSRMGDDSLTSECSDDTYDKSMDTMACVLYLHGGTVVSRLSIPILNALLLLLLGGYYFGSVDQARWVAISSLFVTLKLWLLIQIQL